MKNKSNTDSKAVSDENLYLIPEEWMNGERSIQYRIKEQKYKSGITIYTPEGFFEGTWKNLAYKVFGFNRNGKDWCDTIEESKLVIKYFNSCLLSPEDVIIEEKYHKIYENEYKSNNWKRI